MSDEEASVSLAEKLIESIEALQELIAERQAAEGRPVWAGDVSEPRYPFPMLLRVSENRMIEITPEISTLFASFADALAEGSFKSSKRMFRDAEWRKRVLQAFGKEWAQQSSAHCVKARAKAIVEAVEARLKRSISQVHPREYVFGCHLSVGPDGGFPHPLRIGPVEFLARQDWLDDQPAHARISAIAARRVQRAWSGRRLHGRKPSWDTGRERAILKAVGSCNTVCRVEIGPAGDEAGLQTALTGARLAITAIALVWDQPSSTLERILTGFDRNPYSQHYACFGANGEFGSGWSRSVLPAGLSHMEPDCGGPLLAKCEGLSSRRGFRPQLCWKHLVSKHADAFKSVGEVISYVTRGEQAASRPKMMNAMYQALFWFHEGCREDVDAMAVVKFCSSMDALVCGKGEQVIQMLGRRQLSLDNKASRSTFRDLVQEVYLDGRSPTVHGNSEQLAHDASSRRSVAEQLAQALLLSCLKCISRHPELKDPKALRKPL